MENLELSGLSDSMNILSFPRKKALMLRMGGLGDVVILTVVANQLHKRGYDVDYFVGSPTGNVYKLMGRLPFFKSVKQISRVNTTDCIEDGTDFVSVDLLKSKYDEVFDFRHSVENNAPDVVPHESWRQSINSNYMNWIDLSLAWANIDWTKVPDEEKRPMIAPDWSISEGEQSPYWEWFKNTGIDPKGAWFESGKQISRDYRVIGIQLQASTLIRSWYKASDLPGLLHAQYPDDIVLVFAHGKWMAISKWGHRQIQFDDDLDPLLQSACLMREMDCFISADSGMSHVAEALKIPTIGIYTTVPSWTRVKTYGYSHPIDVAVSCAPCFTLDMFCPLERKKAQDTMSEREKDIVATVDKHDISLIGTLCRKYNTVPKALEGEYASIRQRVESLSANEAACVRSITPEMIMEKVAEVLK